MLTKSANLEGAGDTWKYTRKNAEFVASYEIYIPQKLVCIQLACHLATFVSQVAKWQVNNVCHNH